MSAPVLNKVPGPQIDPAAIVRSKPPPFAGPPLGGLVLGAAVAVSFLIHGALLGTVLVAEPRPNPTEQVESVTVDLVPDTPPEPEKPVAAEEPKPENKPTPRLELPDFSQMMAAQQAIQKQAQPPMPAPSPSPARPSAPNPSPSPTAAQPTSPAAQSQSPADTAPDEAKAPVIETSPQDAVAAAARIADTMQLPEMASLGMLAAKPSETNAKLSADEIAAFRAELRRCWTAPAGIPTGQNPRVFLRVAFKSDGSFNTEPKFSAVRLTRSRIEVREAGADPVSALSQPSARQICRMETARPAIHRAGHCRRYAGGAETVDLSRRRRASACINPPRNSSPRH